MITICPQCQLPLAVTVADLRIAQGQVRCGRCAAVFNALASLYEPGSALAERRGGALPPEDAAGSRAVPAAVPETTDTLAAPRAVGAANDSSASSAMSAASPAGGRIAYDDDHGSDDYPEEIAAAPVRDAPRGADEVTAAPAPRQERDWAVDTMTAAELAALVARADRDEPDVLASIQIAIDEGSEITVLPSESWLSPETTVASAVEAASARGVPRLDALPADDPHIERARAGAVQLVRATPRSEPSLRWLELEPAQPATGSLAASLGVAAEADFGARTGTGIELEPRGAYDVDVGSQAPAPLAETVQRPLEPARGTYAAILDEPADADPAIEIAAVGAARRSSQAPRGLWAATLLLGLVLAAQLAHIYREELVAVPALQGPVTSIHAALGRPIAPRWDVGGYEVRQQGIVAAPVAEGTLTVRASIRNGAGRAQPAPLLRVVLQDRFGNTIATRDLTPREYGGTAAMAPAPMLAPGQRIDAEVSLLDPGGEAVGFELDVCLRRPDASVTCANDAPATHG